MTEENNDVASWREWHELRNRELAAEHGWLTPISFTWLSEERSWLGDFPGSWYTNHGVAVASFARGSSGANGSVTVTQNGVDFMGEAVFEIPNGESETSLAAGTRVAEVARRGGRYCVRVRDSIAPARLRFAGVPIFDYDPAAVVPATFTAYEEPRVVDIETARKGVASKATLVGEVSFEYEGVSCTLAVSGSEPEELTAIFYDQTNGEETADWRFVSFAGPRSDRSKEGVAIDFNRAANFPAAFTPFGTCPKPVAGNELAVAVRAGEKRPAPWINPHA
ncbi:DUF1684 domain-containing protein [Actinomycetaceae bacterium L2_0104]